MVTIPCPCPVPEGRGSRHESDTVTLRERLGFRQAEAIRNEIAIARQEMGELETGDVLAILTEGYIIHGVESWTLEDDTGKKIPVSRANVRAYILDRWDIAPGVADAAEGQARHGGEGDDGVDGGHPRAQPAGQLVAGEDHVRDAAHHLVEQFHRQADRTLGGCHLGLVVAAGAERRRLATSCGSR